MAKSPAHKPNPAAAALGRLGGSAGSRAQQRARRANAQFAGRPRRVCATCGEPVVGGHVDRTLDTSCGAHGWRWQQGDRRVAVSPTVRATRTLDAIAAVLDGVDWTPDTIEAVARLVRESGRQIKPPT